MKKNSGKIKLLRVITSLYKVLAANTEIVAIDYPPRPYKKAVDTILKLLEKHDIKGERTIAEWPHFTLAYVPTLTQNQKEKIKLAAPAYLSRITTDKLIILEGKKFSKAYLCWELKIENTNRIKKLINWICEETGNTQEFEFKPHVSLAMVDLKYKDIILEILPEIYENIKVFKTTYSPEQIQFWENMTIYDIENAKFY